MDYLDAVQRVTADLLGTEHGDAPVQAALELVILAFTTIADPSWDDLGTEAMVIADQLHPLPTIVVNAWPPATDTPVLRHAISTLIDQLAQRLDRDSHAENQDLARRLTLAEAANRLRTATRGFR